MPAGLRFSSDIKNKTNQILLFAEDWEIEVIHL